MLSLGKRVLSTHEVTPWNSPSNTPKSSYTMTIQGPSFSCHQIELDRDTFQKAGFGKAIGTSDTKSKQHTMDFLVFRAVDHFSSLSSKSKMFEITWLPRKFKVTGRRIEDDNSDRGPDERFTETMGSVSRIECKTIAAQYSFKVYFDNGVRSIGDVRVDSVGDVVPIKLDSKQPEWLNFTKEHEEKNDQRSIFTMTQLLRIRNSITDALVGRAFFRLIGGSGWCAVLFFHITWLT